MFDPGYAARGVNRAERSFMKLTPDVDVIKPFGHNFKFSFKVRTFVPGKPLVKC